MIARARNSRIVALAALAGLALLALGLVLKWGARPKAAPVAPAAPNGAAAEEARATPEASGGPPRSAASPAAERGDPLDPATASAGSVQVVDLRSGAAMGGLACLMGRDAGAPRERLTTDAQGRLALAPGEYRVALADGSGALRPASFHLPSGGTVLLIHFPAGCLRVRVVDAVTRAPLPGAEVLVDPPIELDDALAGPLFDYPRIAAGADGVALLEDVPALDASHLAVIADGYEPARLQVCEDARELADGELVAALVPAPEGERLHLRFVDSLGAARAGVLVRASMDEDLVRWAGPDLAIAGTSDASGELQVSGVLRLAAQLRCTGAGWPLAVDGPRARAAPSPVRIEMPDRMPGTLQLNGEQVAGLSATVEVGGRFAQPGEELLARCSELPFEAIADAQGRLAVELPRGVPARVVVTLADGRRVTLAEARVDQSGWTLTVDVPARAKLALLEVVSLDAPIRALTVFTREPGGGYVLHAPPGGAQRIELPLREGLRGFTASSVDGRIVVASRRGDAAPLPAGERLELSFLAGVEQQVRVVDRDGAPMAGHRVELQPVMGRSDYAAPEFQERLDPTGRWHLRAGNLFAATTDAAGVARLELPPGPCQARVAAAAWQSPLRPWLELDAGDWDEVLVSGGAEPIELAVVPLRTALLDVGSLRRSGALGPRWFVRDASGSGAVVGCEGELAELGVPASGIELTIEDELGASVATLEVPVGRGPWRWRGGE